MCSLPDDHGVPFEIREVEPGLAAELMTLFKGERTGFVRVGPKGYFLPNKYKEDAASIYNMPLRDTDIFIAGYPRSGTTRMEELIWIVANDMKFSDLDNKPVIGRITFLEVSSLFHPEICQEVYEEIKSSKSQLETLKIFMSRSTDKLAQMPHTTRRFIKSHLPLSLLAPNLLDVARVVYIARDPKDVIVSFFHFNKLTRSHDYKGDFKTFWNYFIRDLQLWTPYFEHLKEAWEARHHPRMLFLFYEEVSKDLPGAIHRVADFLGKQITEEQVTLLSDHLNIENFKNNKSVNINISEDIHKIVCVPGKELFIRKGNTGGWRDYFDEQMLQQAETWIAKNLCDTDLKFPHSH